MANDEQIRIWNEINAPRWLAERAELTRTIAPHGRAAMDALAPAPGERALDVGCGWGDTTLELARRVGPSGAAVGVDVAEPFIAVARAEAAAWPNVSYLVADAQTHEFAAPFDVVFSRFGVMFFADPAAAFARLRADLRPGGRLGVVVWGPRAENEWVEVPFDVVRAHLEVPPAVAGPGPFALADRAALARLLEGAGFSDVRTEPLALTYLAGTTPEVAAALFLQIGPAAAAVRTAGPAGDALRPVLQAELTARLARHVGPDGVGLASVATVVTARA